MKRAISLNGLALIQAHEGFCADPAPMPDGNWLVGYGHVRIGEPGAPVSENEAGHLLALDVAAFERLVNEKVDKPLTQTQFDALVSFAFSVGAEAFESSQVLRRVNAGQFVAAACALDAWRKAMIDGELEIVDVLVRRRAVEKALFLQDVKCAPSPSALARPKLDHAASVLGAPIAYASQKQRTRRANEPDPSRESHLRSDTLAPLPAASPLRARPTPGQRITEILRSEPATETLLLTQIVIDEGADNEIVTAHAKPVARRPDCGQSSSAMPLPWLRYGARGAHSARSAENFGLIALLLFGIGLLAIGGSMLMGRADAVGIAGASALAAPGLAASLMAGVGLARAVPA